ncbi:2'-5' RNA ligase family protein [Janibacter alittae]|uniref:2'-5' RNA ligase family protein n=1 Tax=Janibacter alittae TaxID=3115209 RepID=A0ABZ2MHU9_9MICO
MTGHTVLQLPVPALEDWVRERTRFYDTGFVSADPRFGHAHITALAPFAPAPTAPDLTEVARIAAATATMPIRLADLGQFRNGVIHLRPEPDGPLRALTETLVAAFPDLPPYEGRFGPRVDPHLTLDAASPTVSLESTRRLLDEVLPAVCTLTHLQLAWWESDRCHVMNEWPLGRGDPLGPPRGTPVGEELFPPPD